MKLDSTRFVNAVAAILIATPASAQIRHADGGATAPLTHTMDAAPAPSGPYAVGRRLLTWTDSTRRDPADTARFREMLVWVWYPAEDSDAAASEAPLPGAWGEARQRTLETKFGSTVAQAMSGFRVHARMDAPLMRGKATLPVLLFTPGLGWLATDYSVLIEDLVSHGYVVVGLSPAGFADVVRYPDGREQRHTLAIGAAVGTDQAYVHQDALFALARVRRLAVEGGSFLRGRLDVSRIGAFGHSMGGTTALVVAARDTAVRAAVNIDGDPMGDVVAVRPRQPLLLISSEVPTIADMPPDTNARRVELTRQGLERSEVRRTNDWMGIASAASSATRIRILGTRHLDFEDAALAAGLATTPKERWSRFGPIDGARGLAITTELVRRFFDQTLRGADERRFFSAPDQRIPEARLEPLSAGPGR